MWLVNILILVFILGLLILVHEFGHFIFAKKSGVHIYEFAIGMGPIVFRKESKDKILYTLRAFPIGGFVQMAGEVGEDDEKINKDKFMCNKPWWQRLLILIAGVTFNLILAFILLLASGLIWGTSALRPIVGEVVSDYPFAEAGIVEGDKIIEINGHKVKTWDKAQIILNLKHEGDFEFVIQHKDGSKDTYEIAPKKETMEDGTERKVFGLKIDETVEEGFINSVKYAFTKIVSVMDSMILVIANLFTRNLSLNALSGPVGIYSVVGEAQQQGLESLIYITAFLSINLAFVNVLPFPAFDGGRVLFLIIEKIKGSPIKPSVENVFHTIGFILLMILMIYITFQDILRLF